MGAGWKASPETDGSHEITEWSGGFSINMDGGTAGALTSLRNGKVQRFLDRIAHECSILDDRGWRAVWFTEDLCSTKRQGKQLELRWRKSKANADRTGGRACL